MPQRCNFLVLYSMANPPTLTASSLNPETIMDLLDSMQDLGHKDQLESARTELSAAKSQNALLRNKIHTLNSTISSLTSENDSLKAEVGKNVEGSMPAYCVQLSYKSHTTRRSGTP